MILKEQTTNELGRLISRDWQNPFYGAVPYIKALKELVDGKYYLDDEKTIILYFLSNANTWRGPIAREVKKELRRRAGIK